MSFKDWIEEVIKIELIDPIECRVSKKDAQKLIPCLSYKAVYWRKGQFAKKRTEYRKQCFSHKTKDYWYFYTGHLSKVIAFCKKRGIAFDIISTGYALKYEVPYIPGITLRKDQKKIINESLSHQHGVIKAPTGAGKTILQLGIMSAFFSKNILLLAHTSSIVNQTVDKIRNFGWDCTQIGGGSSSFTRWFGGKITVATIQSFAKLDINKYSSFFDIVIVDEAHRVSSFDGQYAKVLSNLLAPVRLGFTATLPYKEEAKMALEGLIGPLITEQTINEAAEKKIVAVPKIKIIKSRFKQRIKELRNYQEVYQKGIVENLSRNKQIVNIVLDHKNKNESTLIFVNKIEHGERLIKLFNEMGGFRVPFIKGDMSNERREIIKKSLIKKKRLVVIATTAWKEGVDIPSLNVVFNAGGGKSEIGTLQSVGRGLRRTDKKDSVLVYDFFDSSSHFLVEHFGHRVSLYCDNSWL